MTRVLVATDGSPSAGAAVRRARDLLGGDVSWSAVHVLVPPQPALGGRIADPGIYEQLEIAARSQAAIALDEAKEVLGPGTEVHQRPGDAGEEVCRLAAEIGADMVVTGSRGAGGLRRALLGSTSLYVVNNAPCPVLVVRDTDLDE